MNTQKTKPTKYALLIGPPNAGKTTIFNHLTGGSQKTVNYPGSTVDFAAADISGTESLSGRLKLVDVPGIQSLAPRTEDEKVAIRALRDLGKLIPKAKGYLIISVVDSTQRSRHLSLTKQLIDAGLPVVVALTMTDIALKREKHLDSEALSKELGVPVIAVNGRSGGNITGLKHICMDALNKREQAIDSCQLPKSLSSEKRRDLFNWAEEAVKRSRFSDSKEKSRFELDKWVLHSVFGPLLFFTVMAAFFYSIFSLASPLMDAIEGGFSWLSSLILSLPIPALLAQFLTDGVLGGFAGVLVFVPQIAILFLGIGILENSGYLARAAVLVDKPLSKIGLNGRAFVPMLSGCACAIPAMMAARTIPGHRQRLLCLFLIPLMQCSARLPVYGLLLSLLFPGQAMKSGLALLAIYLGSLVLTAVVGTVAAKFLKIDPKKSYFQLELPSWKWPIWRNIVISVYQQTKSFVVSAGPIIFLVAVTLWGLSVFPSEEASFAMMIGKVIDPIFKPMGVDWRVGVAILLSFAAREVFVSALAVIFAVSEEGPEILNTLANATIEGTNTPLFTTGTILGLIVFFMIAMQCGATVAIAKKEMRSWKLPMIQLGVYISLAYILAVFIHALFG